MKLKTSKLGLLMVLISSPLLGSTLLAKGSEDVTVKALNEPLPALEKERMAFFDKYWADEGFAPSLAGDQKATNAAFVAALLKKAELAQLDLSSLRIVLEGIDPTGTNVFPVAAYSTKYYEEPFWMISTLEGTSADYVAYIYLFHQTDLRQVAHVIRPKGPKDVTVQVLKESVPADQLAQGRFARGYLPSPEFQDSCMAGDLKATNVLFTAALLEKAERAKLDVPSLRHVLQKIDSRYGGVPVAAYSTKLHTGEPVWIISSYLAGGCCRVFACTQQDLRLETWAGCK